MRHAYLVGLSVQEGPAKIDSKIKVVLIRIHGGSCCSLLALRCCYPACPSHGAAYFSRQHVLQQEPGSPSRLTAFQNTAGSSLHAAQCDLKDAKGGMLTSWKRKRAVRVQGSDKEAPCRLGARGFGGCLAAVSSSALATCTDLPGHSADSSGFVQTTRHGRTPGVSQLLQVPP